MTQQARLHSCKSLKFLVLSAVRLSNAVTKAQIGHNGFKLCELCKHNHQNDFKYKQQFRNLNKLQKIMIKLKEMG